MTQHVMYLQGGPMDLTKMAVPNAPPPTYYFAVMKQPKDFLCPVPPSPADIYVDKVEYRMVGGYEAAGTRYYVYAFGGPAQSIVT